MGQDLTQIAKRTLGVVHAEGCKSVSTATTRCKERKTQSDDGVDAETSPEHHHHFFPSLSWLNNYKPQYFCYHYLTTPSTPTHTTSTTTTSSTHTHTHTHCTVLYCTCTTTTQGRAQDFSEGGLREGKQNLSPPPFFFIRAGL